MTATSPSLSAARTREVTLRVGGGTVLCERCVVADNMVRRMRGLLGRRELPRGEGILLWPASSIHSWFMRFSFDAVFVDRDFTVLRIGGERAAVADAELPRRPRRCRAGRGRVRAPRPRRRRPPRRRTFALAPAPAQISRHSSRRIAPSGRRRICAAASAAASRPPATAAPPRPSEERPGHGEVVGRRVEDVLQHRDEHLGEQPAEQRGKRERRRRARARPRSRGRPRLAAARRRAPPSSRAPGAARRARRRRTAPSPPRRARARTPPRSG